MQLAKLVRQGRKEFPVHLQGRVQLVLQVLQDLLEIKDLQVLTDQPVQLVLKDQMEIKVQPVLQVFRVLLVQVLLVQLVL